MVIVLTNSKPDVFITMTCTSKCREITESLLPDQRASDRTEIAACVFRMKLTELLDDINERHIFGATVADLQVI